MRLTPDRIEALMEHQIFVFGSNTEGRHGKGASLTALQKFGAVYGQSKGLQGNSYAIITKDLTKPFTERMRSVSLESIQLQVDELIQFAKKSDYLTFFVTEIGCNLAGFRVREIAPMFSAAKDVENIYLPRKFWRELYYKDQHAIF